MLVHFSTFLLFPKLFLSVYEKTNSIIRELTVLPAANASIYGHTFEVLSQGERLNPFPNKPWFLCVCSTSLLKTLREKEKLLDMSDFSFFPVFSACFENLLPFSSNLKLLSANSCSLEESKICCLEKGLKDKLVGCFGVQRHFNRY